MNPILHHVRRMALLQAGNRLSDAELLELFLDRRDEAAFEALLRRHAPMVLGVCQRVLRQAQDAEDACQATFLVLARKAASLRSPELLGHWLYGIALRTALKARAMNSKRRAREREVGRRARLETPADESAEELLARLDAEIDRLPEKYRLPVVLCELQGKSRKEVATLLGLPEGTLSSRLAYARKLLARRLRTTTALSGALLTGMVARDVSAAIPSSLLKATARAGVRIVSGQALRAGVVSAHVLVLTEGVMKAMFLSKLKGVGAVVLAMALGAGGVTYHRALAEAGSGDGNTGPANVQVVPRGHRARTLADQLDELQMEVADLRKGLDATRERVKVLEHRVDEQGRSEAQPGAFIGQGPGDGSGEGVGKDPNTQGKGAGIRRGQRFTGPGPGLRQIGPGAQGGGAGLRQLGPGAQGGGAGPRQIGPGAQGGAPASGLMFGAGSGLRFNGGSAGMGVAPPGGSAGMEGAPPRGGAGMVPGPGTSQRGYPRIGQPNAQQGGGAGSFALAESDNTLSSAEAALEAAVKALRQHPGDTQAADALDRVLQALQEIRSRQTQSQPEKGK
jgi:RNA polymerase sigma factor (sigma-70 family)